MSPEARTALGAVRRVAAFYRIPTPPEEQTAREMNLGAGADGHDVVRLARRVGLKARLVSGQRLDRLWRVPLPAILELRDGRFTCLIERDFRQGWMRLLEPVTLARDQVSASDLQEIWTGRVVLVTRRAFGAGADPRTYGFRWFVPSLWRYRGPFTHVLLASLFIQLFALATPLFFQLVVDKVLVHKGLETLVLLVLGLSIIGIFDAVLQYLRTYALSHTASRIDAELGSRLFEHLLRLPLGYFETRQTGQTVARVRELETVRQFLTGQGVSSVIDTGFALVLLGVLFVYSVKLAFI